MSFTFSQPGSATTGLQNYDLERGVKNLAPNTALLSVLRRRVARRRKLTRGDKLKKGNGMTDMIQSMVGTLSKSVLGIVDSGADDRDALLTKSFGEFAAALQGHVAGELAKRAPEPPDLLYKGLGTVGRVAGLVSHLADRIKCIGMGKDWDGQDDSKADPASNDVMAFLEHALAASELAMRAAVNEHVEIADDDDDENTVPQGTSMMVLKSADGADIRVKTALPEELAKLACDPALLEEQLIGDAIGILEASGANKKILEKLFDADAAPLHKAAGIDASQSAGGTEGGAAPPNDPNAGDPTDDGSDDGADVSDPMEALNVIGRLAAALLIQVDGVIRMLEGDGGSADTDPGDPAMGGQDDAPPPKMEAAGGGAPPPDDDEKKKPPGGMSKLAPTEQAPDPKVAALEKQVGELGDLLRKVLASPAVPKGIIAEMPSDLSKAAETAGHEGPIDELKVAEALEKLSPQERGAALYKMSVAKRHPYAVLGIKA